MNEHLGFGGAKSFDEWLVEKLSDPKRALLYLKSELEEFEIDGDVAALAYAVSTYLRSQQHVLNSSAHSAIESYGFENLQSFATRNHLALAMYQASIESHSYRVYDRQGTIVIEDPEIQPQVKDPIEVDFAFCQVAPT